MVALTCVASVMASNSMMAPGLAVLCVLTILNFSLSFASLSCAAANPPPTSVECPLDTDIRSSLAFTLAAALLISARRVRASITA